MDLTFLDPRVRATAKLLHALSRDLRRIEQGIGPTADELAAAPSIIDWRMTYRFEPALTGSVHGHPNLADGPAVTSGLFYLDRAAGYARTMSRFYRLGPPIETSLLNGKEDVR